VCCVSPNQQRYMALVHGMRRWLHRARQTLNQGRILFELNMFIAQRSDPPPCRAAPAATHDDLTILPNEPPAEYARRVAVPSCLSGWLQGVHGQAGAPHRPVRPRPAPVRLQQAQAQRLQRQPSQHPGKPNGGIPLLSVTHRSKRAGVDPRTNSQEGAAAAD
jgi:hypothetical protein